MGDSVDRTIPGVHIVDCLFPEDWATAYAWVGGLSKKGVEIAVASDNFTLLDPSGARDLAAQLMAAADEVEAEPET